MKKTVILSALAFAGIQASAQVSNISVTLQPTASYNWFDNNTSIKDGVMVGGRVGFGFGEAFELRGTYEKSVDLKSTASKIDFLKSSAFESRDVDVERIGGEVKANIPLGSFSPYITLGSGIQKLKVNKFNGTDELKSDQIYASAGLGFKVNLSDRLTFNVEGKNTVFNLNPTNVVFTPGATNNVDLKDWLNDTDNTRMYNWSVLAGLQLYLGGGSSDSMSALDRAYYRKFSGGLSGFKLIVEPGLAYINFDSDTNLKDTYLLGGQAGFDFNQYIGLRGYYYQSSENEKISTDWDKLAIYGGDIVAKLNVSRGLVPYLTIGGGYMNVYDQYQGKSATSIEGNQSGYFAKGGLGLSVPVTKNIELFGAANLMYTSSRDAQNLKNITNPDELKKHTMYNAGLRIQLGKGSNESEELDALLVRKGSKNLDRDLRRAYENNDYDKAIEIIEEKRKLNSNESKVRMTPQELESLVEKVIKGVDEEYAKESDAKRIERLENLLLQNNSNSEISPVKQDETSQKILDELKSLNEKVDNNTKAINQIKGIEGGDKTVVVTTDSNDVAVVTSDAEGVEVVKEEEGVLKHKEVSAFAGVGFGDGTAAVAGLRSSYSIRNSNFEFTPDAYISFGSKTGFGLNANVTYGFDKLTKGAIVKPYLGFGLGYNKVADESKFGTNIIIGTSFDVLGGNLYADYTARGFVNIHQVAVGYKFNF